jgi:hypothetical protein
VFLTRQIGTGHALHLPPRRVTFARTFARRIGFT